ncbi:MAG: TA system VapC family ribonuclease toxin [Fibrobacterota bacterium]
MSFLVDTNILVYSSDSDSEFYSKAVKFLDTCGRSPETWCITWVNVFEYLRVVTHPSVFKNPMDSALAEQNIAAVLSLPNVHVLTEETGFFEIYASAAKEAGGASGNFVHDTHIAALMRAHGISRIYTLDTQFRLFPFLKVVNPFV